MRQRGFRVALAPIDEDKARGLRLSWVRTRGDLNDAEAANILKGGRAIRSPSLDDVADDLWLRRLHKLMFGDDCQTWAVFDHTAVPVARFHHRLVAIHPFPNGNGRHARAAADYLSSALGLPPPNWAADTFESTTELRASYLRSLRAADRDPEDLEPLVNFMWS